MRMKWTKTALGDLISEDGRWRIRGPIMGANLFWLYRDFSRVCRVPGQYNTAYSFPTASAARKYVNGWLTAREPKRCFACRDGEHDNYDDDVRMTVLVDPDTNRIFRRGYLCGEHRAMYDSDGYCLR